MATLKLLKNYLNIMLIFKFNFTPLNLGFLNFYFYKHFKLFLFQASKEGHVEVVKELLNHNYDIEARDYYGKTALLLGIFLKFQFNFYDYFFIL